jgi:low affinity Fe/Cu permease
MSLNSLFSKWSGKIAKAMGSPVAFALALLSVLLWAVTGPIFHFSETWQLVINTGTTIITFLMVFLIQNAQNRDSEAVQMKLDELLRAIDTASNKMINIEQLDQASLDELRRQYQDIGNKIEDTGEAVEQAASGKKA